MNLDGLDSACRISARGETQPNAPAFGEPTDYTNNRWPSYSAWANFCRDTGLYDLFYWDNGRLKGGHPGAHPITKEMQIEINAALERIQKLHPDAKPTFENEIEIEGTLCRLTWLKYWVDWSLENCKHPVIANT